MMYKYGYEDGSKGFEAKLWVSGTTLKVKIYGSDHWYDWLVNITGLPRRHGYHRGWYIEAKKLERYVAGLIDLSEIEALEVVGHSAGGAIAVIFCILFQRDYPTKSVKVTTFNAPSHGAKYRVRGLPFEYKAMVHRGDIVRHLPLFYAKPKVTKYGKLTWFWKAHLTLPEEWRL